MRTLKKPAVLLGGVALLAALVAGTARLAPVRMGKQPDGSFLVSSGQRIEGGSIRFRGRPIELALHPTGAFFAVLNKSEVFLGDARGVREGSQVPLKANAGFRGMVWSPDGSRLYASTAQGHVQVFELAEGRLSAGPRIAVQAEDQPGNPVPGGMVLTRDGKRLFVVAANRNAVVEIDPSTSQRLREYPVENLPFEPRLTEDETTLIVSNWGGRLPRPGDRTAKSQNLDVVVDDRGVLASGSVSLIDLASGATRHVEVGLHPTGVAVRGRTAYVANAMSDSISEVDLEAARVVRTIPLRYEGLRILGAMPNALAIRGDTLYVADGGDNAVAEIDLTSGEVRGYRPAGYFPTAIDLAADGQTAFVLNTKGNGSVSRTSLGQVGNAHDFQGTVTVVDLTADLRAATETVARDNHWRRRPERPALQVYNGAIEHVIYIIKENRTYDEVFGDLPLGNGDPRLCSLGETVMPNHRKLAREFTLFDNGYVSGTNSADGHAWSTQSLANEYLEHFYVGYSRTYPDDGNDAMALSAGGALWDAALQKGKTLRVYGEYCDDELNKVVPQPRDWFEVWDDRQQGMGKFTFQAFTRIPSLKAHIHPEYLYWPLWQSDQQRADLFIKEYEQFSQEDRVPNLMILSLPCDHAEGTNPKYPTPRAMMADNDLALGRIVEAVSNSPQWKSTCLFVIEDDAQSGPDHVDGHRTVFLAISPYTRRGHLDSTFYTTTHMIRSIEMMLGLDPMNRFDALADPMVACFSDTPDFRPYAKVPNNVALDERNPSGRNMTAADRFWLDKTLELDWSHIDAPDPYWLNRINWYSIYRGARPYPGRPGERPGMFEEEDAQED
jgi:DNA-binding beta-propeller fold protein YncE